MKISILCLIAAIITMNSYAREINYKIIDTGQEKFFNSMREISGPVSGIEETGKFGNEIEIYPNPASDYIFIKPSAGFQPAESSEFRIYNALGELMLAETNIN